jgi:hypothetical protein
MPRQVFVLFPPLPPQFLVPIAMIFFRDQRLAEITTAT